MKRAWYRFQVNAQENAEVAELLIFDIIGYDFWTGEGVTAKQFVKDLAALPASVTTIKVRVNSPGGDVFDAVAIANALKQHKARIEMSIEGLAASAATIITCAGDDIRIADNALMMVHNPWSWVVGSAKDMRKMAEDLDTIRGSIVATYRWVSKLSAEALGALMDAETWMDADEAIANGFATEKVEGLKAAALLESRAVAKLAVPDKHRERVAAFVKPEPTPPAPPVIAKESEVLDAVVAAGLSAHFARELVAASLPMDAVKGRVQRAKEIKALCAMAKLPDLADGYIRGSMAAADVKAHLTIVTAKAAGPEIDPSLQPGQERGDKTPAAINTAEIYERFNHPPATPRNGG